MHVGYVMQTQGSVTDKTQETKIAELAEVMPMDRAAGQAQSLGAKQHLEESGTARSDHKD